MSFRASSAEPLSSAAAKGKDVDICTPVLAVQGEFCEGGVFLMFCDCLITQQIW